MNDKLFHLTRARLTGYYVAVMALILNFGGIAFDRAITGARWHALHRELESVAGTLHDGLEPNLDRPGEIEPSARELIPDLCIVGEICAREKTSRRVLGTVQQEGYYARFLTRSGRLVATVGRQPDALPWLGGDEVWQTLQDRRGRRYHHFSLLLHTADHQPWGYLQVGRSLDEFDENLATTRRLLLIGLPVTMLFITGASWWLAGLAMRPVYRSYLQIRQFTGDVAHELRTPLAALRATVESALESDRPTDSEARNTLETIERQNDRLIQLVQDLLLLSRVDLQTRPLKNQPVNLNTLVADIADEFEALAIAAGLQLRTEVAAERSIVIAGDEEQMYRLVANLVTNAIRYTPEGGVITLRSLAGSEQAVIEVEDTGIGIPAEEFGRIFDRFYRVESDRSRHTGGAGLGLAIAKAIASAHRGTISVKSEPGRGSLFLVHFPLSRSIGPASDRLDPGMR